MGMVKVEKIGSVSIKRQDRDGALYLSYWSSIQSRTITRKINTANINTARKEAARLDREIRTNKAPMVGNRVKIQDALLQAIAHSSSKNQKHRKNLSDNARYFTDFLSAKYPGLTFWDDVRYPHLA
jgi:hypothetical protein